jgi:hypothetical protein
MITFSKVADFLRLCDGTLPHRFCRPTFAPPIMPLRSRRQRTQPRPPNSLARHAAHRQRPVPPILPRPLAARRPPRAADDALAARVPRHPRQRHPPAPCPTHHPRAAQDRQHPLHSGPPRPAPPLSNGRRHRPRGASDPRAAVPRVPWCQVSRP